MKYFYSLISFLFLGNFSFGQDYKWTKQIGSSSYEEGRAIVADDNGYVYTTGYFQGTTDLDPNSGTLNFVSQGLGDIFVQKLDPNGNLVWAKQIGSSGQDSGYGITLDANGNVIITGYFSNTADFDPGTGITNLSASSGNDIFILKLDVNGDFIWAKSLGGASGDDIGRGLATDVANNIYVTGEFEDAIDFDFGVGTNILTSVGNNDVFVLKIDENGNHLWAQSFGGTLWDVGESIAVDANGNVFTTGYFRETVDFDPGIGTQNITSNGINDIFIHKLDTNGDFVWAKTMGGTSSDFAFSIQVDNSNNIYTAGHFINTVDFDPNVGNFSITSAGSYDVFVHKMDNNGTLIWAKSMGGGSDDYCYGMSLDANNNIYTTGYFYGTSDFNPGAATNNLVTQGNEDVFISKLDVNGDYVWAKNVGGWTFDTGKGISTDGNGNVYATGYFQGTVDFNPNSGTDNFTSNGLYDLFILKLGTPCTNVTGTDVISACDSMTWIDGITYYNDNSTAQHTIFGGAVSGCDSIVTLNLTINTVDVTVTTTDPTITANTNSATAYQWLDCGNNYALISGENNQSFTASLNENYAVEITENGCTDTSICIAITTVGLNESNLEINITANQSNQITIYNSGLNSFSITVYDLTGKTIYYKTQINSNLFQFEVNTPNQILVIQIKSNEFIKTEKINLNH